jgi:hypothetical protein
MYHQTKWRVSYTKLGTSFLLAKAGTHLPAISSSKKKEKISKVAGNRLSS